MTHHAYRSALLGITALALFSWTGRAHAASASLVQAPISDEAIEDNPDLASAITFQLVIDSMGDDLLSVRITALQNLGGATIYNDPNETPNDGEPNAALAGIPGFRSVQADSYFSTWASGGGTAPPTIFQGTFGNEAMGIPPSFPIELGSPLPPEPQNTTILQFTLLNADQIPSCNNLDCGGLRGSFFVSDNGQVREIPIPEPGSAALVLAGVVPLVARRREGAGR